MSYKVFPQLSGITWNIKKRPTWNTTKMLTAAGNEFRTGYRTNPLTEFDLSYSYLSPTDKLSMEGFFNGQNGALTPFYFDLGVATNTASDNSVTAFTFGIGDGSTTTFTLIKPAGTGSVEPVGGVNGSPLIYKSDWQGNQLQYSTPRTNSFYNSANASLWLASGTAPTFTAKTGIVPSYTAQLVYENAAGNNYLSTNSTYTAPSSTLTLSFIVEASTSPDISFGLFDQTGSTWLQQTTFTFSSGTFSFGNGTETVHSFGTGPNGGAMYKISVTVNNATAGHQILTIIYPSNQRNAQGTIIHAGQIETGAVATSFIVTAGAPVTVTDYTLAGNQITFAVAPLLNAALTWTGNFYYLVRFMEDVIEFNQLMNQMYELQECKLVSVQ